MLQVGRWVYELKTRLKQWFPLPYCWLRNRLSPHWWPIPYLFAQAQGRVASGPFQGMRYLQEVEGSWLGPKLVGSYECELHGVVAEILAEPPRLLVDIGCGEGYYAVGFARALPGVPMLAYDISSQARALCAQLAHLNGVRLEIRAGCDLAELGSLDLEGALVFCDCEGAELDLLRPDLVPGLTRARLVVELHDSLRPGITSELVARFQATHRIQLLPVQPRQAEDYPILAGLAPVLRRFALAERSTYQEWGYFVPLREWPG